MPRRERLYTADEVMMPWNEYALFSSTVAGRKGGSE